MASAVDAFTIVPFTITLVDCRFYLALAVLDCTLFSFDIPLFQLLLL